MRIRALAYRLGTTPHAIRFYERRGLLPAPSRASNRYREYGETDVERLRLLIGLCRLNIPLSSPLSTSSTLPVRCERRDMVVIASADTAADAQEDLKDPDRGNCRLAPQKSRCVQGLLARREQGIEISATVLLPLARAAA